MGLPGLCSTHLYPNDSMDAQEGRRTTFRSLWLSCSDYGRTAVWAVLSFPAPASSFAVWKVERMLHITLLTS